jgi:FemAB-related protein (PEP-CTERM system-associated)
MDIRLASERDAVAWDRYVLNHSGGLAYHQFAWKRAVTAAYKFDSRYLIAEDCGKICGILPLIVFRRPFSAPSYVSLPYCDIGGCLAESDEVKDLLVAKAIAQGTTEGVSGIDLRTGSKTSSIETDMPANQKVRMVLELPDSAETLLKGLKAKLRSQVNKPLRDGLTFQLGGSELVADFYQVFAENMRDLGSPVHSRCWVESVVTNFAENARIGLVYTPEKELAAAGIILLHGDIVSIPWASSLRRFNRQNPNMMLYWHFLAFAADHGFRYFDFGRSTPGEGTYKFKQQWGAKPVALDWTQLDMNGRKSVSSSTSSTARTRIEACWQRMPLPLCNYLGPLLRRYISL